MIPRYTLPEMGAVWSERRRFQLFARVEVAVVRARVRRGLVPAEDLAAIEAAPPPPPERVHELDAQLHHDVIAFLTAYGEGIGPAARHVHYGMTSSDLLDTALALQLVRAADLLSARLDRLVGALRDRALEHRDTLCLGRTHGVAAEPTTFGLKLAGHAFAFDRDRRRLAAAREAVAVGKLSGAVGTYSNLAADVEAEVLAELELAPEDAATQVVARDRHAQFAATLALVGANLERLAVEIRHLQRTEVREAEEPFAPGQKGSSAMPHKRNPTVAERLTGIARLLRGYALPALEDVALWHERDISHSSAERVILPDACCVLDYGLERAAWLVAGLRVFPERMRANLEASGGLAGSSSALLALIDGGWSRDDAYAAVQRAAMAAWEGKGGFRDLLLAEPGVDEAHLLLVTTDRISAFDVVLQDPIPGRGTVLTALTQFWLERTADLVPNHLVGWRASELPPGARQLAGRAMLVRRLEMIPFECIARGYLVGSGWKEYRSGGTVCGIPLPEGLREADRLPEPLFTPSTKALSGHDENVSEQVVAKRLGAELAGRLHDLTIGVYRRGAEYAAARGILLADTKFEFGLAGGEVVLADEVLTPDSSRFWPAGSWEPGSSPPSFDKQFVRDWLETTDWDKTPPAPRLPAEVVDGTAARYREAYERLSGRSIDDWLAEART